MVNVEIRTGQFWKYSRLGMSLEVKVQAYILLVVGGAMLLASLFQSRQEPINVATPRKTVVEAIEPEAKAEPEQQTSIFEDGTAGDGFDSLKLRAAVLSLAGSPIVDDFRLCTDIELDPATIVEACTAVLDWESLSDFLLPLMYAARAPMLHCSIMKTRYGISLHRSCWRRMEPII